MEIAKFLHYEEKAYQTVYAEPEESFHKTLIPRMVKDFIPQFNLKQDDIILDIGCGPGLFIKEMNQLNYTSVIGVTLSNEDFKICQDKNFKVIKSSMSDLDFKDDSVDFIWCRHALEHSPYPLFTLYEFNRVLKETGKVYIEVPAPDCVRGHEANPNHYSILGHTMWIHLFIKANFKILFANFFEFNISETNNNKTEEKLEKYIIYGIEKCKM
jgi:SAM-dependent methyltransferase